MSSIAWYIMRELDGAVDDWLYNEFAAQGPPLDYLLARIEYT